MKHVFIAVILAFSLTFAARGAEAPLPENVAAHVTFRAPARVVEEAFAYVDAATAGTERHIPVELLTVLLTAYLPAPLDAWDADSPLHLVFLDGEELHTMVVVFGHGSFPTLLEGLADADWDVPEKPLDNEDENLFREVRMVGMASGMPMFLADLGDGRAVLAEDIEAARYVITEDGAELGREAAADIAARIRLAGMEDIRDMAEDGIEIAMLGAPGVWTEELAEKYGALLGDELEKAEEVSVTFDFDGETLSLASDMLFADGSWMRKWAETAQTAPERPESAFLAALPEGAFTLGVGAPPEKALPDAEKIAATVLADIAALAPENAEALNGFAEKIFAAAPGATAFASYLNGGKPHQIAVLEFGDADAALAALESIRGAVEQSFAEDAGIHFHAARLEGAEAVVVGAGEIGGEEFAAIVRGMAEKSGAGAKAFDASVFDAALPAQFFAGRTDLAESYLAFLLRIAEAEGGELPAAAFGVEPAAPPVVFGVGAENGRVALRSIVSAAAVGEALRANERAAGE